MNTAKPKPPLTPTDPRWWVSKMTADNKLWCPLIEPVDKVTLNGLETPGRAEIEGAGSPRRWDERESYGYSGAFIVFHGNNLSHFTIRLTLHDDADWLEWYSFKPIIDRVPLGKRQRPLAITHPITAGLGIFACVVEDCSQPTQNEDGLWQIEIKMIEWRSPRLALAAARDGEKEEPDPEDDILKGLNAHDEAVGAEIEREHRGKRGVRGL